MKFLIVDDSSAMRKIIIRTLKQAGYEDHSFIEAVDGREGLKLIDSMRPDIVLTDWHMPEMSGLEMLQALKERGSRVRIGLVTTERSAEKMQMAEEAGALFVVNKPFTVESLQEAILPVLDEQTAAQTVKPEKKKSLFVLPHVVEVENAVKDLMMVPVKVRQAKPQLLDQRPMIVGLYGGEDNRTRAMWVCDLYACGVIGGSLTLFPPHQVFNLFREHKISEGMFDNVREILNVFAGLFYRQEIHQEVHLTASHIIVKPNPKLDDLMTSGSVQRLDMEVQSDSYGKGRMVTLVVD